MRLAFNLLAFILAACAVVLLLSACALVPLPSGQRAAFVLADVKELHATKDEVTIASIDTSAPVKAAGDILRRIATTQAAAKLATKGMDAIKAANP